MYLTIYKWVSILERKIMENIQISQIKKKIERLSLQLKYLEELEKLKSEQDSNRSEKSEKRN